MKVFSLLFLFTSASYGQCAMCKAVVESGDKGMAEGVNDGIVYLMIFPYLLIGVLGYALYRYKTKKQTM
jgi:cobalamin biosynthesis protein CobD/CbiB